MRWRDAPDASGRLPSFSGEDEEAGRFHEVVGVSIILRAVRVSRQKLEQLSGLINLISIFRLRDESSSGGGRGVVRTFLNDEIPDKCYVSTCDVSQV